MLFFHAGLNILIFLPILAPKYSCIILELQLKKKEFITFFLQFLQLIFVYLFFALFYRDVFQVPFIELSLALNIWLQPMQVSSFC